MDMVIWNWKPFSLWEQISNIYHPCFIAVVQEHARRSRDRDQSEVEVGFECCNFLAKFGVDPLLCRLLLKNTCLFWVAKVIDYQGFCEIRKAEKNGRVVEEFWKILMSKLYIYI